MRIDNTTYQWLGEPGFTPANLTNIQLTPTCTIFEMQAGPVNLTITYLMPIEVCYCAHDTSPVDGFLVQPSDWIQQSLPFSYVSLEVVSTDGAPHNVEAYADINGGMFGRCVYLIHRLKSVLFQHGYRETAPLRYNGAQS